MAEIGYKVVSEYPYTGDSKVLVAFKLETDSWSKLEKTQEWKSFAQVLEKYQREQNGWI